MSFQRIKLILEKIVFDFLGTNFLMPKTGHRQKNQPVLGSSQHY